MCRASLHSLICFCGVHRGICNFTHILIFCGPLVRLCVFDCLLLETLITKRKVRLHNVLLIPLTINSLSTMPFVPSLHQIIDRSYFALTWEAAVWRKKVTLKEWLGLIDFYLNSWSLSLMDKHRFIDSWPGLADAVYWISCGLGSQGVIWFPAWIEDGCAGKMS